MPRLLTAGKRGESSRLRTRVRPRRRADLLQPQRFEAHRSLTRVQARGYSPCTMNPLVCSRIPSLSLRALCAGYEIQFDEQLITVFSASNYCGVAGNKGSFMVILPDLSFQIVQFDAKPKEKLSRARMRHSAIENDVIRCVSSFTSSRIL